MNLEVIFEDNHQLVVNKPSGILTQPSGTQQNSLETIAKEWVKQKYHKPGSVYLHAVHRLDKPASGVVLFAKTSKALSRLQKAFQNKQTKKVYLAIVEGWFSPTEGYLEHDLIHDEYHASVVSSTTPGSKKALLLYRVLHTKKESNLSVVEVTLLTGRYHQIRAQFAAVGHPIIGDTKYGSTAPYLPDTIALHHQRLEIAHPISSVLQVFEAPWSGYKYKLIK